ncbi:hypothetical protein RCL1_007331 [Eukaryota sp. TZLM3-RCL]
MRASFVTKAAFLGGISIFLFEFRLRFPDEVIDESESLVLREADHNIDNQSTKAWIFCSSLATGLPEKKMRCPRPLKDFKTSLPVLFRQSTYQRKLDLLKRQICLSTILC